MSTHILVTLTKLKCQWQTIEGGRRVSKITVIQGNHLISYIIDKNKLKSRLFLHVSVFRCRTEVRGQRLLRPLLERVPPRHHLRVGQRLRDVD